MLVEDDNNLREIYEARLQAEGYTLVSAKDGEEALVLAKNEQPDLIISDVMMPKVSGFEMLDILRNTDGLKEVKVVMLTALGQSDDQKRADLLGADRYLVKSQVTLEDIVNVTHELLNDNPVAETAPIAAPQPAPVTVEAMPMATPPVVEAVAVPEPQAVPIPTAVADVSPVTDPVAVQTSSQEQADVTAEIENFVSANPVEAVPDTTSPPTAETVSDEDDKVMAAAIDNLVASTPDATAAAAKAQMPVPAVDLMAPQVISPTQSVDGNVPIANKKVISPLDAEAVATRPDLNELLAIENAKEQAATEANPAEAQTANTESEKPFDANNIAL